MDISDTCDKNFLFPPMGNERLSWVWAIFPVVPNQPSIQAKLQIQIYYSICITISTFKSVFTIFSRSRFQVPHQTAATARIFPTCYKLKTNT